MYRGPLVIKSDNLSHAWASAFLASIDPVVREINQLVVIVSLPNGSYTEDRTIRTALDAKLDDEHSHSCQTVASTIFPLSLWNEKLPREDLFERYNKIFPRINHHQANHNGTYFQRLISFGPNDENQLENVLITYNRTHRRSAFQASIFTPGEDHKPTPFLGFPCLQHVMFTPINDDELYVTGIYAVQYLFKKAYGNYLGLCHLGQFMAHEMDRKLTQMSCVANVAKYGDITKKDLAELVDNLKFVALNTDILEFPASK